MPFGRRRRGQPCAPSSTHGKPAIGRRRVRRCDQRRTTFTGTETAFGRVRWPCAQHSRPPCRCKGYQVRHAAQRRTREANVRRHRHTGDQASAQGKSIRWSKRQNHRPKPRWSRHHERSTDFRRARHRFGLRAGPKTEFKLSCYRIFRWIWRMVNWSRRFTRAWCG